MCNIITIALPFDMRHFDTFVIPFPASAALFSDAALISLVKTGPKNHS